ncbi:hypothetical protein CDAR_97261 [Caerostris darwini]|uniref:Uncharacterized protein n=1 Tax=Caerostris darwini TaxID=1538125 RepID=A0AAV4QN04_9ARAC|nr:hypothetical protein CDAR_97261 [Caerostris darwini]
MDSFPFFTEKKRGAGRIKKRGWGEEKARAHGNGEGSEPEWKENLKYITNKRIQRIRNRISCSGNIRIWAGLSSTRRTEANSRNRKERDFLQIETKNKSASSAYLNKKKKNNGLKKKETEAIPEKRSIFTANRPRANSLEY